MFPPQFTPPFSVRFDQLQLNLYRLLPARQKARQLEDEWLQRNKPVLDLHPYFEICRWRRWKESPAYECARAEAERLFETNEPFEAVILCALDSFLCGTNIRTIAMKHLRQWQRNIFWRKLPYFLLPSQILKGLVPTPVHF